MRPYEGSKIVAFRETAKDICVMWWYGRKFQMPRQLCFTVEATLLCSMRSALHHGPSLSESQWTLPTLSCERCGSRPGLRGLSNEEARMWSAACMTTRLSSRFLYRESPQILRGRRKERYYREVGAKLHRKNPNAPSHPPMARSGQRQRGGHKMYTASYASTCLYIARGV